MPRFRYWLSHPLLNNYNDDGSAAADADQQRRRRWFSRRRLDCAVGSNSRANSWRASRSHQIYHPSPEFWRNSGSITRHHTPQKLTSRVSPKTGQLNFF